jgi:hypothetical protein
MTLKHKRNIINGKTLSIKIFFLINRCAIRKECHTNEIDNQKRTKYKEGGQKTETLGLAKSIIRETKPISSKIFLNYQDIYTTYYIPKAGFK